MWFLRRIMRVSWTEKKSNKEILRTANCNRNMIIKMTQTWFIVDTMRKTQNIR